MSKKYPTLTDMGIANPDQIDRYSLQASGDMDILRIVYKREKGSILPGSKKFKFPRKVRIFAQDGASRNHETISEVSPALNNAITELHQLVNMKHSREEKKEIINDEIVRLEEEISTRISHLKSLINALGD